MTIDIEHFPEFKDELDFTKQLVLEQSVFCLPGMVSVRCIGSMYGCEVWGHVWVWGVGSCVGVGCGVMCGMHLTGPLTSHTLAGL